MHSDAKSGSFRFGESCSRKTLDATTSTRKAIKKAHDRTSHRGAGREKEA